jgi:putative transcriptional regulator
MICETETKRISKLELLRKQVGKTRAQVGMEVGVTERNVYDWEHGKFLPRLDRAVSLARSLNVSIEKVCEAMGIDVSGIPTATKGSRPDRQK